MTQVNPTVGTPNTPGFYAQFAEQVETFVDEAGGNGLNISTKLATTVDPKYFGAVGDGVTDDTAAIHAAFAAAPDGSRIDFSPGEYLFNELEVDNKHRLAITGRNATFKRKPIGSSPDFAKWAGFTNCSDISTLGIRFDNNGLERFGGWSFLTCDRVRVDDCYAYDSDLDPGTTFDHYWLLIQHCNDVWVQNNQAEDIELIECNWGRRTHVIANTSVRCAWTQAIGTNAGFAQNDAFMVDCFIERNTIIDASKDAIMCNMEGTDLSGVRVTRLHIKNNNIVRDTVGGVGRSICLTDNTSGTVTDNLYEDVHIEGNKCISNVARNRPEIFMKNRIVGSNFLRSRIMNNLCIANGVTGEWVMDLRQLGDSRIEGNIVRGATFGISFNTCANTVLANNSSGATNTAYLTNTSAGGNRIYNNHVYGTPTTSWSGTHHATDNFVEDLTVDTRVVATASLPAAGAVRDGNIIIEDNGTGDRNLIIYAGGQRFRIDGGAAF